MRSTLLILLASVLFLATTPAPAPAQEEEQRMENILALFEAYQVGFLQVVAISCYQVYSSTGIIATDYANGYIDEDTAGFALSQNALLLSACSSNVLEVSRLTAAEDTTTHAELDRIEDLLAALNQLVTALDELLDNPEDAQAQAVEDARAEVERLLDSYAASDQ